MVHDYLCLTLMTNTFSDSNLQSDDGCCQKIIIIFLWNILFAYYRIALLLVDDYRRHS